MIFIRLAGGLGNQLFQYSAGIWFSKKQNMEIAFYCDHLDKYETKREFMLKSISPSFSKISRMPFFSRVVLNIRLNKILPFLFPWYINKQNISNPKKLKFYVIDDYFQDYFLIKEGAKEVVNLIKNQAISNVKVNDIYTSLISKYGIENLIAMHFRRGDYLNKENKNMFPVLGVDYYKNAIKYFKSENALCVIFSENTYDDFEVFNERILVNDFKLNDWEQFLLMSMFSQIIIANSTFSFWAAIVDSDLKTKIGPAEWSYLNKDALIWKNNLEKLSFVIL